VIGFKVLSRFYPVHIVTTTAWLIYRILLTSDLHSGYEFPWDVYKLLPFSAPASYHDYHHSHNVGNFASSFMLIEALNGNNDEYYKFMANKKL
jgi:sterol desaturase/sphingolipid hydroxylase (fatty acid hydroxylase superfamily)